MYRLGLIGYPIKHSLSPWIHDHFLKRANLKGTYDLVEIETRDAFQDAVKQLREQERDGFNITVPYKQDIIPYLDDMDPQAKRIGAVNTVLLKDGKWIGYNTDGKGYVRSLKSTYPDLFSKQTHKVLILGAGGAARGIYEAIVHEGFQHVDIANRTVTSAEQIAQLKQPQTTTQILTLQESEMILADYDAIIQTTSVGMAPHTDDSIIDLKQLRPRTIVSDIVYQPFETRFLQEAKRYGARIHHGHTMLLYQAQYAFEIWTGQRVSIEQLEKALRDQLTEGK